MPEINNHVILSYVDAPTRILIWSSDQVLVCLFPLAIGMITGNIFAGIGFSLVASYVFKKFQRKFGRGRIRSILYWNLPTSSMYIKRGLPPSCVRLWIK